MYKYTGECNYEQNTALFVAGVLVAGVLVAGVSVAAGRFVTNQGRVPKTTYLLNSNVDFVPARKGEDTSMGQITGLNVHRFHRTNDAHVPPNPE